MSRYTDQDITPAMKPNDSLVSFTVRAALDALGSELDRLNNIMEVSQERLAPVLHRRPVVKHDSVSDDNSNLESMDSELQDEINRNTKQIRCMIDRLSNLNDRIDL